MIENMIEKYDRVIYWSVEDNKFIVEAHKLPGCFADGMTMSEAIKNSDVIIDEWIETAKMLGREVPCAKGRCVFA